MQIAVEKAKELKELLEINGYDDIATEVEKVIKNRDIGISKLIEIKACEHKWHKPDKEELNKLFNGSNLSMKDKENLYYGIHCRCENCGVQFIYQNINFDKVIEDMLENFKVNINFGSDFYEEFIKNEFNIEVENNI